MALPDHPMNTTEEYLAMIAEQEGAQLPDHPRSRMEQYLEFIAQNGGKVTEGYFYNNNFYKDSAHTELITPKKDCLYIDKDSGILMMYNGTAYIEVGGKEIVLSKHLSLWDCTTGMPVSFPHSVPYEYIPGAWYWVKIVAAQGGTNYKPTGTSYTGAASAVVDTETVGIMDVYVYDGNGVFNLLNIGSILLQYYTKAEVDALLGLVKTTLDSPIENRVTYNLGNKSAAFPITLPANPTVGFSAMVMFDATAVFTPTITGGTLAGESIPATVNGKHYDYLLFYNGSKWEFSALVL